MKQPNIATAEYLGLYTTKRRLSSKDLSIKFQDAKIGDFIINIVKTKTKETIYRITKYSKTMWLFYKQ